MVGAVSCPYFRRAFGWCIPIGGLGGLIGLGGGEFRLPVLMYGIGYDARSAVPLNLLTSSVTLAFALAIRSHSVSLAGAVPHLPEMAGLLAGGMASAFYGAKLIARLGNAHFVKIIAVLLGLIGLLMIGEAFLPVQAGDLFPGRLDLAFRRRCCHRHRSWTG
jgi:uncharacterized protein